MVKSTTDPRKYSIPAKDASGNDTGVYLFLDKVNAVGEARIIGFLNIIEETLTNDFDNSTTPIYEYD